MEIVNGDDSCWLWQGTKTHFGYGQIRLAQRRNHLAHRVIWELVNGPIPDGLSVLHRCDNPPCVRPDHLFLGTLLDNVTDMVAKGRQAKGVMKPMAILTEDQVREIRRLRGSGMIYRDIAAQFGVCVATIGHIMTGRQWGHVV